MIPRSPFLISILLLFIIFLSGTALANDYVVQVTAVAPCHQGANITIRGYTVGQLGNGGFLELERISYLDGTGLAVETIAEPGSDSDLDFIVLVTNPSCDPGLIGNATVLAASDPENFGPPTAVDLLNVQMSYDISLTTPGSGATVTDNTTTFIWNENGGALATYTLIIDDNSGLGSPAITQSGITNGSYTLTAGQQLSDDTYYWAIDSYYNGTFLERTAIRSFTLIATGPSIQSITPAAGTWTNTGLATTVTTNIASECAYAFSSGTYASKTAMTGTGTAHSATITLASQGQNTVFFQCNNSLGTSAESSRIFKLDSVRPDESGATMSIEGGATLSNSTTLTFTWSGFVDPQPGRNISSYYYSFSNGGGTSSGTNDAASPGTLTNAAQGTVTVYVWAVDANNNYGLAASDTIVVDTLPPSFGAQSLSPSDLTKYTSGVFRVCYTIPDTSGLIADPDFRYRVGSDAFSAYATMAPTGGSNYCYNIAEPTGGWISRSGETIYWEVEAVDLGGRNTSNFGNEFIDNSSTAPNIHYIADYTFPQGNATIINITWDDPDPDTLVLTSNISLYGGSVTQVNNTFGYITIAPSNDMIGINPIYVQITDGLYIRSRVFYITVTNTNDDPVLSTIENQYVHEYYVFNYSINATDIDGDTLTYSTNDSRFSVNSQNGIITYIPTIRDRGSYAINVSVSDGMGGLDRSTFTVTVGYCGDETCNTNYESCDTCEVDCLDSCETYEDSAAISINPRNCINYSMRILAAKLVRRTTCETKGAIIDEMEVCGNLTNTELSIQKDINGTFYDVSNVITDSNGIASWTPTEVGSYKIEFQSSSYEDKYTLFTAKACTPEEIEEMNTGQSGTGDQQRPEPPQPDLEEPSDDLPDTENTGGISWVYLLILPLLSVVLAVTVLRYVYVFERKKEKSAYVHFIDSKIDYLLTKTKKFNTFLKTNPKTKRYYDLTIKYYGIIKAYIKDYYRKGMRARIVLLSKINAKKSMKIPYFDMEGIVHSKHNELIVLSVLKFFRKKEPVNKLLDKIEHKIELVKGIGFSGTLTLLDIGTICANLNLKARFEKRPHSIIDIKMNAVNKIVCLCDLVYSSSIEPGKFVRASVIIDGFTQTHVIIHNYNDEKKRQHIPYAAFMKAWKNSGATLLLISKH